MKLSLAMIVKNEEEKLARCLDSVKGYVDELVVVDTGSTDRTKEIANSFGASVYDFPWCNDFSKARNFSIEKTTGDFVFVMDADSYLLEFNREQIMALMKGRNAVGLAEITNSYTQEGQRIMDRFLSAVLFPREVRYTGPIHEQIDPAYPRIKLPISIFHDGYENRDAAKFKRNIDLLTGVLREKKDTYLMYKLGQEYRGSGQLSDADIQFAAAYSTAEKSQGYYPKLVVEYIGNLIQLKKFDAALEIAKKDEMQFADYPEFHFVCGQLFMEAVLSNPGKYISYFPKIKVSYEKSIAIGENPKYQGIVGMGSFMPLHNLGAYYEVTGNVEKARECYQIAGDMGYLPSKKRLSELAGKRDK